MSSRSIGALNVRFAAMKIFARDGVGRHLDLANGRNMLRGGNVFDDHLPQLLRRLPNAPGLLAEQRRESLFGGHQAAEQVERNCNSRRR